VFLKVVLADVTFLNINKAFPFKKNVCDLFYLKVVMVLNEG
jgi:hypothetical protein